MMLSTFSHMNSLPFLLREQKWYGNLYIMSNIIGVVC